jgi:hypothetical protein
MHRHQSVNLRLPTVRLSLRHILEGIFCMHAPRSCRPVQNPCSRHAGRYLAQEAPEAAAPREARREARQEAPQEAPPPPDPGATAPTAPPPPPAQSGQPLPPDIDERRAGNEEELSRGPCAPSSIEGYVCQKAHVNGTLRIHWTPYKAGGV